MQLFRDVLSLPTSLHHNVTAIGNFDGVHLGHHAILQHCLASARTVSAPACVLTFEPHPREYFNPDAPKLRLMKTGEKIRMLRDMGFAAVIAPRFNDRLAATTAQDFVHDFLLGTLKTNHIVTGSNFCFGHKRGGDSVFLSAQARQHGFSYDAIAPIAYAQQTISSSAIREALRSGDVAHANRLLGRPYTITGHVMHGDKRGRTIGFPTLNLSLAHLFTPRLGVYAARVMVDGVAYKAVANIGIRPTFGGLQPRLEVHLFDFLDMIYGKKVHVELHHFIRDEQIFPSLDTMTTQLHHDSDVARKFFAL